jgi:DNA-binding NarL/FixJ family response regulator
MCFAGWNKGIQLSSEMRINLPSDVPFLFHAYIEYMADIRVMIVDDVERVRQDLCTFLSLAGNIEIVGEARDGLEAVRLAQTLHPQVILMDLEMPIMDGYEAARQVKVLEPACHIVALSIHADESERQQALQAGMIDLIAKGAPLEMLLQAIRECGNTALEP